jgi:hypothetical protein
LTQAAFILGQLLFNTRLSETAPKTMKKSDCHKLAKLFQQDEMISGIVWSPAVLYFPPEVLRQLNEFCSVRQLTPGQLMAEAFKSQDVRFDQFVEEVMTPLKTGELRLAEGSAPLPDMRNDAPLYSDVRKDGGGSDRL